MMSEVETVASIRQYINRLDDSVSSERLKSLLELQTLSKTFPKLVGENCIQRLFVFLYEQGSTEEYQETLDLIIRLVKCKDTSISTNNVALVLQETRNVELLLDMLEHEDLAVAVMVNQVLTEIHSRDNASLERLIQDCPAGMNKLLQRLSDHLREEVRNQALVFVKQLTAHNEEVKKTVVFNEGFEILFGIIRLEGGVEGSGPVIIDCLEICRNLLTESETCQRFFFGMGIGWTMQIVEFFTPEILEIDVGGEESQPWFEDVSRARCASTALEVLVAALGTVNVKHQNAVVLSSQSIVPAVCHWLVRRGPVGMARSALLFLECAVIQNQEVASRILNTFLVFHASRKGRTVPLDSDVGNYINSWKMSLKEERCCINVPLLLTESYIYSYESWRGICDIEGTSVPKTLYLDIFEQLLRTEDQYAGLIIQYILAPVMQDESDNEAYDNSLEMAQSLGKFVISIIYDSCRQLLAETNSAKSVPATAERASNILVVLFLHGGVIARELATALTTAHCQKASTSKFRSTDTQSFLPFLLNCVGRINRLQGSQTLVSSILWVLTVAAHECDRATKLMLDDPTNLFVLELASPASDAAGVTASTQTLCCLFLGSCLLALSQDDNSTSSLAPDKFLQAIDSKIGLTRFLDLLKRPMQLGSLAGGRVSATSLRDELFVTVSFRGFYEDKVEAIRKYIFEHYSGISGGNSIGVKASDNAVVEMQRTRIEELEAQLEALNSATGAHPINGSGDVDVVSIFNTVAELEAEKLAALKNVEILSSQVSSLYEEKQAAQTQLIQAQRLLEQSEFEKQALEQTCNELSSLEVENAELLLRSEAAENRLAASKQMSPGDFSDGSNNFTDEILLLKESVLRLEDEKSRLREVLDTRDRKIALLEDELRSPMPGEANRDRKITELENRNAELKQQMWGREAELSDLRNDLGSQIESYEEKLAMYKSLLASTEEQLEEDKFLIGTLKEQVEAQKVAPVQTYDHSTNLETEIDKPQTETLMAQVEELTTRIDVLTTDIVTRDEEWRSAYNALEAVRAQLLEELATADSTRAELMDQLAAVKVNQTAENSIEQHTANEEVFDLQKEVARLSYELSIEQEAHKRDVLDMKSAISEMHFKMSELLDLRISLEQELQEATLNRSIATPVTDEGALVKDIDTSESTSLHLEEMTSLRRQLDEEVRLRHDLENEVIYLQSIIEDQKAEEASDAVELRSKLALMEKELLQLRNDSTESDLAIQFEEIEKMKHFLTEEVRSLQEKLTLSQESTETVTTNLEKELSESETKYADILTVNDSYRSEIEVLTTQISAIEQERVQLKDEVTQLREELSASQVIASVDATDDADKFSALTASLEQANGEITDLAATITAREVELASTRKQLQTLENNSSEQHHQINESKLRLAEETATFEQSIGDLQKELADSVAGRHKLENDIIYLESELNDLRAAASSSAAALHARSDLETRLAQLESDKEALNQQILQLSGESHQSSREELLLREKLADHAEAYAALELAQTQISKELSTVRLEHAELQQKFAKNMDDSQRLQKQLLSAEAASAQLHKELINAQDYSGTLSAELENYKTLQENHSTSVSALRTQASELQRLNAEVDSLTKDLHTAKAEVTRLQDYCTRQEGEAAGLRLALRNSEEDLQSILEENNQLSNQTSSETRKLQELRDEVARLNNELQLAKSAHTELVSNKSPQQTPVKQISSTIMATPFSLLSPSAHEMKHLHSELVKERRRLHSLQEEHTDLLGLLAQQELELTVFRKTLEKALGLRDLRMIEDKARQVISNKYGSYTDYRSNIDMGNFEIDGI